VASHRWSRLVIVGLVRLALKHGFESLQHNTAAIIITAPTVARVGLDDVMVAELWPVIVVASRGFQMK
jgi:hypothetical protein